MAGSRACDGTDAVSDVRPPGRVDGAAGTLDGVEGCRVAGAAPRGRGAAPPELQAQAGLDRPGGARRADVAAPEGAADRPPGDAGYAAVLTPAAGPLALDLSPPQRSAAGR